MANETKVGNHKIWWDEDHELLRYEFVGELNVPDTNGVFDAAAKILGDKTRRLALVDLSGLSSKISSECRKTLQVREAELGISKTAMVGASAINRMVAKMVLALQKKGNNAFFKTVAEGLAWLKEE